MPLYEYRCGDCGAMFEALVPVSGADTARCRSCGAVASRLLSLVAASPRRSGDDAPRATAGPARGGCCGGSCGCS